jgi:hypothetical protein
MVRTDGQMDSDTPSLGVESAFIGRKHTQFDCIQGASGASRGIGVTSHDGEPVLHEKSQDDCGVFGGEGEDEALMDPI